MTVRATLALCCKYCFSGGTLVTPYSSEKPGISYQIVKCCCSKGKMLESELGQVGPMLGSIVYSSKLQSARKGFEGYEVRLTGSE